jgi:hypothetical protein
MKSAHGRTFGQVALHYRSKLIGDAYRRPTKAIVDADCGDVDALANVGIEGRDAGGISKLYGAGAEVKKLKAQTLSVGSGKLPAPVRVKLKRVNCDQAIPYPPNGQTREWWQRLKDALGTSSSAFVQASLNQLIAAARLPGSGISEIV